MDSVQHPTYSLAHSTFTRENYMLLTSTFIVKTILSPLIVFEKKKRGGFYSFIYNLYCVDCMIVKWHKVIDFICSTSTTDLRLK